MTISKQERMLLDKMNRRLGYDDDQEEVKAVRVKGNRRPIYGRGYQEPDREEEERQAWIKNVTKNRR